MSTIFVLLHRNSGNSHESVCLSAKNRMHLLNPISSRYPRHRTIAAIVFSWESVDCHTNCRANRPLS